MHSIPLCKCAYCSYPTKRTTNSIVFPCFARVNTNKMRLVILLMNQTSFRISGEQKSKDMSSFFVQDDFDNIYIRFDRRDRRELALSQLPQTAILKFVLFEKTVFNSICSKDGHALTFLHFSNLKSFYPQHEATLTKNKRKIGCQENQNAARCEQQPKSKRHQKKPNDTQIAQRTPHIAQNAATEKKPKQKCGKFKGEVVSSVEEDCESLEDNIELAWDPSCPSSTWSTSVLTQFLFANRDQSDVLPELISVQSIHKYSKFMNSLVYAKWKHPKTGREIEISLAAGLLLAIPSYKAIFGA